MIQKMPALVERTRASLRILRARKVALELQNEARMLPKPQAPPQAGVAPKRPIGFELPHQASAPPKPTPAPEPQILTTIKSSRPVAGFGRKLAPAPEPVPLTPGQTVFTEMPRARTVQGNQPSYGSVTPALKGERLGRPTASATKGPPGGEPPVNVPAKGAVQTPKDVPQTGQVKYDLGNPRRYAVKEYFEGEAGAGGQPQARDYVDMKLGADGIMQGDFVLRGKFPGDFTFERSLSRTSTFVGQGTLASPTTGCRIGFSESLLMLDGEIIGQRNGLSSSHYGRKALRLSPAFQW